MQPNAIVVSDGMQRIELLRARIDLEREILEFEQKYFTVLHASGLLPKHITTWQQFSAITSYGRMLGIDDVWTALRHIPVVNGNPSPDVQLMLALIKQSGLLQDMDISDDGRVATCTMIRVGGQKVTTTFSQAQAENIITSTYTDNKTGKEVVKRLTDKDVWRNYPDVMRKWRAAGQAARLLFPDVINGLLKMPPGSYVVVSEDPDALMASPASKRASNAASQLGNGNDGKERRMSDPPATPLPRQTDVTEAEFTEESSAETDQPARPFTLSSNPRTGEIGPAHPSQQTSASDLQAKLDAIPEDPQPPAQPEPPSNQVTTGITEQPGPEKQPADDIMNTEDRRSAFWATWNLDKGIARKNITAALGTNDLSKLSRKAADTMMENWISEQIDEPTPAK